MLTYCLFFITHFHAQYLAYKSIHLDSAFIVKYCSFIFMHLFKKLH